MALPNNPAVVSTLRRSRQAINPQGAHGRAVVAGFASRGTLLQLVTLRSDADLAQHGNGEGIEAAAEIGSIAGYPVDFVAVPGTGQAPGAVTKDEASAGVPLVIYGFALLDGSTFNGDIGFQAKVADVSLVVQTGGALAASVIGKSVTLTIPAATLSSAVETFWLSADPGAVAARALIDATFYGTKAGTAGTSLSSVSFNNGAISYVAPEIGYSLTLTTGVSQALAANYATKALTVALACNSDGQSSGTASAAVAAIAAAAPLPVDGRIAATLLGDGTGRPGFAPAGPTSIQFGSTGAMTVGGTGTDDYSVIITITRGGTVGSTGLAFQWSADGGYNTSSDVAIPVSGVKALSDGKLDTGLTVTFTGTLEVGDRFRFTAGRPVVAVADLLSAADVACAAVAQERGFFMPVGAFNRTQAAQLDAKLQAAYQTAYLRSLVHVRDYNNSETRAQFEAAIANDFTGFVSDHGLVRVCAGHFSHLSPYTGRTHRRPVSFVVASRRCAIAVHQDPMEKELGGLPHIQYTKDASGVVTNPGIYYDAYPNGALPSQRFICLRSWPGEDGVFYVNTSPTMGDASDAGYALIPLSDVIIEANRVAAKELAQAVIGKSFRFRARPEGALIPAGAIDVRDANAIDARVNSKVNAYLDTPKTDNNRSASDSPQGEKRYQTRRDYSYAGTNPGSVKGRLRIYLRPIAQYVELDVEPALAG